MSKREAVVRKMLDEHTAEDLLRDCYYDEPRLEAAARFQATREWNAISALLPRRGRILDLGAGQGIASLVLAQSGRHTVSLEPSRGPVLGIEAAVALARAAGGQVRWIQGVGEMLPFASGAFDAVYCRQVLHHTQDMDAVCREIARVLRPGGRFLACGEHVVSSQRQLTEFLNKHPFHADCGDEAAFRLRRYRRALRDAGFTFVEFRPLASEINIAPYTWESLRHELSGRVKGFPGGVLLARLIPRGNSFASWMRVTSRFDRRPGRPYTFLAEKQS